MIPLQWLYSMLPTWRLHMMNFLLLLCNLVATLVMLPSVAPWFSFLSYKLWSFATLDNTCSSFLLPSRSSILNLVYLCYFRSSISDFQSYIIPLSHLSNAIVLTQFGFSKRELYPISHNALIMECFSRAHLYGMPRVTVSSFGSEINIEKTKFCVLFVTFYRIPIRYSERELWRIYQGHFFEINFRSL